MLQHEMKSAAGLASAAEVGPRACTLLNRPCFAWISEWPHETAGASFQKRKGFFETCMTGSVPPQFQWIRAGWHRVEPSAKLPTVMTSIPRSEPPQVLAGLDRTPQDALDRLASDSYRFPPAPTSTKKFLLTDGDRLRYADAGEKEILMDSWAIVPDILHFACLPRKQRSQHAHSKMKG